MCDNPIYSYMHTIGSCSKLRAN